MEFNEILATVSLTPSSFIGFGVVLLTGTVVSLWTRRLTELFFVHLRFDRALERVGWKDFLKRADITVDFSVLSGIIVQIFFITLTLMIGMDILGLHIFSGWLEKMVLYYPNIIISVLIFTVSVYLIDISQKIVVGTKTLNRITYSRFLGKAVDYSIRFLAFLAICYQLSIIPQLVLIIFIGVIATITLSLGISLGLAAKEPMARFLHEIKKSVSG
jgi:hypothetical protein